MPKDFSRSQRLGAQMLRSLSELLHFETKDPGLTDVSLTAVDLSKDLSIARVYFSLLDPNASDRGSQTGGRIPAQQARIEVEGPSYT